MIGRPQGNTVAAAAGKIGENLVLNRVAYVEGDTVAGYVHSNGKIGVLVDLAGGDTQKAKDVALHVAAERPQYLTRDEVNSEDIEKEREILTNKALNEGKPLTDKQWREAKASVRDMVLRGIGAI